MGVSPKNKRKIIVNNRTYYWYVKEDPDDFPYDLVNHNLNALNIVSEDKRFIVRYYLGFKSKDKRYLVVIGKDFAGKDHPGTWQRVKCPEWCKGGIVTPKDAESIIKWCMQKKNDIVLVDFGGNII